MNFHIHKHKIHSENDIRRKFGENCVLIVSDDTSDEIILMRIITTDLKLEDIKYFLYNTKTHQEKPLEYVPQYLRANYEIDPDSEESKTSSQYIIHINCLPNDKLHLKIKRKKKDLHFKLRGNLTPPTNESWCKPLLKHNENIKLSCVLNQLVRDNSNSNLHIFGEYHVNEDESHVVHENITNKVQINYLNEALSYITGQ